MRERESELSTKKSWRGQNASIKAILRKALLCWTEHVIRREGHHIPLQLLYGRQDDGERKQGRPHRRYNDALMGNFPSYNIKHKELRAAACHAAPINFDAHC